MWSLARMALAKLQRQSNYLITNGLLIVCISTLITSRRRCSETGIRLRLWLRLLNATKAILFVDRAYVYDNSIDNQLPRLLYRTTDGELFKQYVEDIPEWAGMLLKK